MGYNSITTFIFKNASTLYYNEEIIISGQTNFLQVFDPKKNQYKDANNGISINNSNILINNKGKIYILSCGNVFSCEDINCRSWKKENSIMKFFGESASKPAYNKKCAYFATHDHKVFQFNCKLKTLKLIKDFEW